MTKQLSSKAYAARGADLRNGTLKEEWLKDPRVLSFINALYEVTTK